MSEQPLQYAHDHHDSFLSDLQDLLRIPSISTLPAHRADMERAAEWIQSRLGSLGLRAQVIPGLGHPLVYAEWLRAPGAPTVLVYGHYDVQPVDPLTEWITPPFEPDIRHGNIYARGASDDKGQTFIFLCATESFLRTVGKLPINVKFLIEGEEECGGGVIKQYVREHGEHLRAHVAQVADTGMFAPGVPTIDTALRGNVYTEVTVRGAARDLHSGLYGGVAPNPLNALAHIVAGLKDRDGRITIPGFYDNVRMPEDEIRRSWHGLPRTDEELRAELGVPALTGEPGFTTLEQQWARPTLDVHGIVGGFMEEGAKTVIPAEATAKVSMRLVPDQRAERIFRLLQERVQDLTPASVTAEVRLLHGDDPVELPLESPYIQIARDALSQTFGRPCVPARSGGSIPIVTVFQRELGLDTLLTGFGLPDDNLHAPNEKFSLENFFGGINAVIRMWEAFGRLRQSDPPQGDLPSVSPSA